MNEQYGLFASAETHQAPSAPFQRRSRTSRAAAHAIAPKATSLRARVLKALAHKGKHGATDEELCMLCFLDSNTLRPRRVELVKGGFAEDSGRTRRTLSGRQATVWVAK